LFLLSCPTIVCAAVEGTVKSRISTAIASTLLLITTFGNAANSDELKILGTRVTSAVLDEIGPQFEQATGYKPVVLTDVAIVWKRKIESGESFDVAVLVDNLTDELIKSGKIIADTRSDIIRTGIGVAVRRGAPKPDIGSVDAFKRALLSAKSIAYLKEGASGLHIAQVIDRLGIAGELQSRTKRPVTDTVSDMVAAGEVELGMVVIPNILSVPGAELVGPIPQELQSYVVFTGGVATESRHQAAARELLKFLKGPMAVPVIKAKGMEPG
jgi:molybdate transport system substrate-binding protein